MTQADIFKATLEAQLGEPYVLGDEGPDTHDCSGLHYEGMRAAGVLWKGRPWPRETANDYKNKARPLPVTEPLKVGDPCFFLGTSGHAYHVASFVGYDETAVGWTIEARGRKWGVVKYRLNDPANGVLKRGGRFYRYPGVDLGELTEDDIMTDPVLRECILLTRVSSLARSWDEPIAEAREAGDQARVAALKNERKMAVEAERLRLGLTKAQVAGI